MSLRLLPTLFIALSFFLLATGCSKRPQAAPQARLRPEVAVVTPTKRTIVRVNGQPGFIEAYEQTSIYAKVSGFIDVWKVDIGDTIKKDQLLVHVDVPELVAEYEEKIADVGLYKVRAKVAEELVKVADENWKNAGAQLDEARANLGKYAADVARWKADFLRIDALYKSKSIEAPVLDESRKHLDTAIATQKAAESGIVVAQTTKSARKVDIDKANVDVDAAYAQVKVAQAAVKRVAALVGYTFVKAPYDGIVVTRNVNTGDFVRPAGGDQSGARSMQDGAAGRANPLYVVARTDKVRIFLDVPEMEAAGVRIGSKAWVSIEAVDNIEVPAQVSRTSWALSSKSRSLRVEIDIPNPDRRILPNMYAYGKVEVERSGVWAVPLDAIVELGNQTVCYEYQDGKAALLPIQRGIDDGTWVEVTKKRIKGEWAPFDGSEQIITGNLAQLSAGEPVRLKEPTAKK